ncbi:hypothetical protein EBR44_12650, partial [bacterium]|nr:hypothetical protein [bacterium]
GPGWTIRCEYNRLRYEPGMVGMALSGKDTGGSQWFVTLSPQPHLNGRYTIFARVTRGLDVAGRITQGTRIDRVEVLPFTPELARFDATQFVDEILRARFGMGELLVGYDHGFGRDRSGHAKVLRELGAVRGFDVIDVPPVQGRDGTPLSSTRIRQAVAAGDLARAADGLGRPYSLTSRVVHGDGRGRTLGFRTLNLEPVESRKLLPPEGVYAVTASVGGQRFAAMMNLGPRPTFGDPSIQLEVHLFDAEGDWYGQEVEVGFIRRLRDTQRFDSPAALVAQLRQDAEMARVSVARGIGLY